MPFCQKLPWVCNFPFKDNASYLIVVAYFGWTIVHVYTYTILLVVNFWHSAKRCMCVRFLPNLMCMFVLCHSTIWL